MITRIGRVPTARDDPYKALGKSTLVFFLGSFASRAISLVVLPLFTPHLIPSVYGSIDIITTTILIAIPLLSLNVTEALFRFSLESQDTSAFRTASALIGSGAVLVFAMGVMLVDLPGISSVRFQILLVFSGTLYTGMLKNLARAERRFWVYAGSDIIYALTFVGTGWYLIVIREGGLQGYLLAQALSLAVELILIRATGVRFRLSRSKLADVGRALKPLLVYALPLIPNSLSWWIVFASGRYLISAMIGMSATGLYAVAYKIPSVMAAAQGVFYQAWQIESIDRYGDGTSKSFYTRTFNLFVCANVAALLLLAPFLSMLIRTLTARAYWTAWQYAPLLMVATVFSAFSSFFGVGYLAMKRTGGALRTSVMGAAVNIALNLVLIPHMGIQAAGLSMLAGSLVTWLARVYDTRSSLPIRIRWGRMALGMGLCGASFVVAYGTGAKLPFSVPTGIFRLIVQSSCIAAWLIVCRKELVDGLRWCLWIIGNRKARTAV